MEHIRMQQEQVVEPQIEVAIAGKLSIGHEGPHQIKSSLLETQTEGYLESVEPYIVEVEGDNLKRAVCMDGRQARCLASDVMPVTGVVGNSVSMPEQQKPPVRPKMAGGLYDMAAMMAVLADWSGVKSASNFNEAHGIVSDFLNKLGYKDAAHTSDQSFNSSETTECGAWMKKQKAMEKGARVSEEALRHQTVTPTPLDEAVAGINGYDEARNLLSNQHYQNVRRTQRRLVNGGFFDRYDPIKRRNEMAANNASGLELLISDPTHLAHGHREPLFIVNMRAGTTVDRDALNERDGFAPFVDDRWMRQELAQRMAVSHEEEVRLLFAGDVVTVDVSDELLAPGMPVAVIRPSV